MELTSFDEANTTFDKPSDMTYDECQVASVFKGRDEDGYPVVITCWKVTAEELEEIQRTGRVWCTHAGHGLQPHSLSGKSPFKES
jgi:hypothetical protein